MEEIWKDISGYEGYYQVSNLGNIKSMERLLIRCDGKTQPRHEHLLEKVKTKDGYDTVCLSKNHRNKRMSVHRLVAEAFIPNPYGYNEINHIDHDRTNNIAENLEWCTHIENIRYSIDAGRRVLSQNGIKGTKIKMVDKCGDFIYFETAIKCAEYLIEHKICRSVNKEMVSNKISRSTKTNTPYCNCHFSRV